MASFDSLAREFRSAGVQFILLTDDAPGGVLDSVLQDAAWRASADVFRRPLDSLVKGASTKPAGA